MTPHREWSEVSADEVNEVCEYWVHPVSTTYSGFPDPPTFLARARVIYASTSMSLPHMVPGRVLKPRSGSALVQSDSGPQCYPLRAPGRELMHQMINRILKDRSQGRGPPTFPSGRLISLAKSLQCAFSLLDSAQDAFRECLNNVGTRRWDHWDHWERVRARLVTAENKMMTATFHLLEWKYEPVSGTVQYGMRRARYRGQHTRARMVIWVECLKLRGITRALARDPTSSFDSIFDGEYLEKVANGSLLMLALKGAFSDLASGIGRARPVVLSALSSLSRLAVSGATGLATNGRGAMRRLRDATEILLRPRIPPAHVRVSWKCVCSSIQSGRRLSNRV
jgi:hypothetical protein